MLENGKWKLPDRLGISYTWKDKGKRLAISHAPGWDESDLTPPYWAPVHPRRGGGASGSEGGIRHKRKLWDVYICHQFRRPPSALAIKTPTLLFDEYRNPYQLPLDYSSLIDQDSNYFKSHCLSESTWRSVDYAGLCGNPAIFLFTVAYKSNEAILQSHHSSQTR